MHNSYSIYLCIVEINISLRLNVGWNKTIFSVAYMSIGSSDGNTTDLILFHLICSMNGRMSKIRMKMPFLISSFMIHIASNRWVLFFFSKHAIKIHYFYYISLTRLLSSILQPNCIHPIFMVVDCAHSIGIVWSPFLLVSFHQRAETKFFLETGDWFNAVWFNNQNQIQMRM